MFLHIGDVTGAREWLERSNQEAHCQAVLADE